MHYRGLLRVARREGGIRLYAAARASPRRRAPGGARAPRSTRCRRRRASTRRCRRRRCLPGAPAALRRAAVARELPRRARARESATGQRTRRRRHWYWPAGEHPARAATRRDDAVRLLAPFDPVVWDRRRFELFWGWPYRFEAYTPAPKRKLGYYALPLLWRDRVIGWANVSVRNGPARDRISLRRIGTGRSAVSRGAQERARTPGRIPGRVAAVPAYAGGSGWRLLRRRFDTDDGVADRDLITRPELLCPAASPPRRSPARRRWRSAPWRRRRSTPNRSP